VDRDIAESEPIFNLSSGKSITVMQMSEMISASCVRVLGTDVPIFLPENSKPSAENYFEIQPSKFIKHGYKPDIDFTSEFDQLIAFCKKHFSKP
jgi:hypothetical protein